MMKRALLFWIAPLVVFVFPWAGPALRGHWRLAACWAAMWLAAIAVMVCKWAGPGLIALVALGLLAVMTCHVDTTDT
jgi:hypothetical protein